jgi:hypothetical protein
MERIILPKGERSLARLVAFVSALASDRAWKIEVSEHKTRRSDEQNRYLWGVVYATILKHLPGWDAEDVHEYFLGEHFGWETLEGLGRRRVKPIRRSSKLNKTEFGEYVGFIQRVMAARGVYIPEPGEVIEQD